MLVSLQSADSSSGILLAALITVLVAAGRSISFRVGSAVSSHMGTPALIVGVLLLDPALAALTIMAGALLSDAAIRRPIRDIPLSVGIAGIQALVALGVVHAAGWDPVDPSFSDPLTIFAVFLAGALAIASAGFILSVSAWLRHEGPLVHLFQETMDGGDRAIYLIDVSKICFGLIAAMLVTWSPIHVLLIVVPVATMSHALTRGVALRRRLEQALHETEHSLAEAQRLAQLGSWEWEISSRHMRWSGQLFEFTGIEPGDQIVSLAILRGLLPLSERNKLERIVGELLESHGAAEFDHEITRPDGTVRYVHHVLAWAPEDGRAGDRLVGTVLDITHRKQLEIELRYQAYHDGLTGLPNREQFLERLEQCLVVDLAQPRSRAVIFLDLDHFKEINDRYGHEAGDEVLIEVARRLESHVEGSATVARLSGDEFTVLVDGASSAEEIELLATKLLESIQHPVRACGNVVPISASAGLVYINDHHDSPSDVLREADSALYQAKGSGRSKLWIAPSAGDRETDIDLREPA